MTEGACVILDLCFGFYVTHFSLVAYGECIINRNYMRLYMKKKILLSAICTVIVLALSIGVFYYYHPTHPKFNDRFIIGKTEENIIQRYGEFTNLRCKESGEIICGTYMIHDDTPELIMSYDDSLWYEIYFENGIATKIRLQEGRYGG